MKHIFTILLLLTAGCTTTNPDIVPLGQARKLSELSQATVLAVRDVTVQNGGEIGAALGGVVGGVAAGSRVNSSSDSIVAGTIGATLGAALGNAVHKRASSEEAVEIIVQTRNGTRLAVVQGKGVETFSPGDTVLLINSSGKPRVIKAAPMAIRPAPGASGL